VDIRKVKVCVLVKKIIRGIINIVSILLVVFSILAMVTILTTKRGNAPKLFGFSAFRVLTGSMEPTYLVDTMVIVKEEEPDSINAGDVISFYSSNREILGLINTHRVVEINTDQEGLYFTTKGDANPVPDEDPVRPQYVIGRVVASSVLWGKLVRLISNPLVFAVAIVVPLLIILISNIVLTAKTAKEIELEEIEEIQEKKKQKDT